MNNILKFPKRRGVAIRNAINKFNHYKSIAFLNILLSSGLLILCFLLLHMLKGDK